MVAGVAQANATIGAFAIPGTGQVGEWRTSDIALKVQFRCTTWSTSCTILCRRSFYGANIHIFGESSKNRRHIYDYLRIWSLDQQSLRGGKCEPSLKVHISEVV